MYRNISSLFLYMSKKEFYKSLTKEQRDYIDFLIDEAYSNGYDEGKLNATFVNECYKEGYAYL